jgi:thiol-disulfide isomerase/thioredoxin
MHAQFIIEPGNIEISYDTTMYYRASIKGTPMNDRLQKITETFNVEFKKAGDFRMRVAEASKTGKISKELYDEYLKRKNDTDTYISSMYEFIKSNITNPVGEYFLFDQAYSLDVTKQQELLFATTPQFQTTEGFKRFKERVYARVASEIGKPFVDIKGKDLSGKEIALSDYAGKGKVVLVDFWASWCGPCIYSLPNIAKLQQEFNEKDFRIIGVSLDANKKEWEEASKEHGVNWPQLSGLKGWEDEAAKAYGVNAIPHTILIDKNGIIVEKDFDTNFLSFRIEELLSSSGK